MGFIVLGGLSNWAIARIHLPPRIKTRDGYMYRWKRIYISQSERDQRIQKVRDYYLVKRKTGVLIINESGCIKMLYLNFIFRFYVLIMKCINFLVALFLTNLAYADVNKCVDAKGKINFTDKPCLHGQAASNVKINSINIADSSTDKRAMRQVKQHGYEQAISNYHHKLRNARIQSNARSYEDNIKLQNDLRMSRSKSPLPNGLGSGKGCYKESNQYYCY